MDIVLLYETKYDCRYPYVSKNKNDVIMCRRSYVLFVLKTTQIKGKANGDVSDKKDIQISKRCKSTDNCHETRCNWCFNYLHVTLVAIIMSGFKYFYNNSVK